MGWFSYERMPLTVFTFWGLVTLLFAARVSKAGVGLSDVKAPTNRPPTITCPCVNNVYTARRETSTVVTWPAPSVWDPEDGNITVHQTGGNRSGSEFEAGTHLVLFEAVDSGRLRVTCQIQFQVLVRKCPEMSVTNGYSECSHDNIYGSVCRFRCHPGFETTGETDPGPHTNGEMTASCEIDQRWVGVASQEIICEMIQCEQPVVRNGQLICKSVNYNSVCFLSCDAGYNPIGQQQTLCLANKTWTPYGQCRDVQPPTISCPTTIEAPAGPKLGEAVVFWDMPEVSDNSGLDTEVVSDVISGSNFSVGKHVVTFTATDASKNSNMCKTFIKVAVIYCPEYTPAYKADVTCSHGAAYGSECITTCHPGYELRNVTERAQTCLLNQSWSYVKPGCRHYISIKTAAPNWDK
ncbi:sushi-repeat-containing protein SRPX-like [Physella acuta]|uniref:sushi-repeat-containing protein SRPX-like n=1 Tax=Physella acuta TaxID=109671 RepID=UPI0027DDFC48|nr:sushi-repeat-containing protein SRPX-like [Physella acuta]